MKCPRCKKQLRKGAKFCPTCGARVEKKRGIRFTSILLVIVLLLSIVAIGWSGGILFAKYFGGNFKDLFSRKETIEIHNVKEAIAFTKEFGEELGYENALSELTEKVTTTIDGDSYYRLQQNYQGIPVYGRTVVCATDGDGNVTSITGNVQDIDRNINLTPSITLEQAQESIRAYATEKLEEADTDITISEPITCIYNGSKLAYVYTITMNGSFFETHEVLVGAHDAGILEWNTYAASFDTNQNVLEAADVNCKFDDSHNLKLADTRRSHSVHYLDLKTYQEYPMVEDVVGNSDFLATAVPDQTASGETYALAHLAQISDFYADVLGRQSYNNQEAPVYLFSCDADLLADQGKSLACPEYGVIMLGAPVNLFSEHLGKAMDLIAHEYAHLVFQTEVGLSQDLDVTSVNEGIADIFGNLIELYVEGEQDPNWPLAEDAGYNKYNMADPITMNSYGNEEHANAQILSHGAYLMWNGIDNTASKKLTVQLLAKLWYRAMLMMPSDCNFIECRYLVELAAQSMEGLSDKQIECVSEAFDAVGIYSDNPIETDLTYTLQPDSTLSVLDKNGEQYSGYTLEIQGLKNTILWHETSDGMQEGYIGGTEYISTIEANDVPITLDLPYGYYAFTISDKNNPELTYTFSASIGQSGLDEEIIFYTDYEKPLIVKITDEPTSDVYASYIMAAKKTTESGSWSEHLTLTANMAITDGGAKTKTKVTMTSEADVSNYSESDLSKVRVSGSAEMSVMGQTYAWDMEYENGTAHYQYTKPTQTSADMKIDPSFFNFGTMTSDMMSNAKISGNKITFTVPGEKIAEVGIAAVNQMSGVDDLEYGDVDVTVTISDDGKIDNIVMVFHASLEYQGYDADVDYNIDYRFSDSTEKSNKPTSSDIGNLQEYLDFSKSWGIRKDVSSDPNFYMEQVYDFAFMEDGTFYCFFYQQYTDFLYGFHGTYLFESNQIKFYFDNDDGTSTEYAYSFDPDEMKLTQVSEKGIWNSPVGTEYGLVNDEWFPSAQDIIDSTKSVIASKGKEMGG